MQWRKLTFPSLVKDFDLISSNLCFDLRISSLFFRSCSLRAARSSIRCKKKENEYQVVDALNCTEKLCTADEKIFGGDRNK